MVHRERGRRLTAISMLIVATSVAAFSRDGQPSHVPVSGAASGRQPGSAPHAPVTWQLTAAQITDSCNAALRRATAVVARIDAAPTTRTPLATVILPVERASGDLAASTEPLTLLENVSPDSSVRRAAAQCDQVTSEFGDRTGADPVIYRAALSAQTSSGATTQPDRQLVEDYVEAGRYSGAGLDSAVREHVLAQQGRLHALEQEYQRALSADSTTVVLTRTQLRGIPSAFAASLHTAADGVSLVVPVNESTAGIFYANAEDPSTRKAFYFAFANRGGAKTLGILRAALGLRDSLAHAFGAPNWAAHQLTLKMVKSPARVEGFLDSLDARLLPKARAELAELAQAKQAQGDAGPLEPWDIPFEQNRVRITRYAVSDSAIRRYFPVDKVVSGVLAMYQAEFGLRFAETGRQDIWAPGVREFSVTDAASGAHLGWFYLDLFPRRNKFSHFATIGIRSHTVSATGRVTEPIAAVVGNWPPPTKTTPSLLSHDDVVTFFHEFGHVIADLLDESPYETTGSLRQDFVEAPSQAFEFWAWDSTVVRRISADYATGKPMPDSLLKRMLALKHFDEGLSWTGQIMLASFDMALHSGSPRANVDSLWASLKAKLTVVPWVSGTSPASSFVHLMAGYDAGYYGYLWSRVYAADIFSRFTRLGVLNPEVGSAYRRAVLAPAGTVEPDAAVRAFLGRPVSNDAFLQDVGAVPRRP